MWWENSTRRRLNYTEKWDADIKGLSPNLWQPSRPNTPKTLPHSPAPALFVWLVVQVIAIVLSACRVPLWARAPQAGEFLAMSFLLVAQVLSAALLMPRLVCDLRTAAMAAACAWPFTVLAGFLAAAPGALIFHAGAYLTGWLFCLWVWRLPLSSTKAQMIASGVAAAWSAGGVVLWYCRIEFASDAAPLTPAVRSAMGPLVGAMSILDPLKARQAWPWLTLAAAGFAGAIAICLKKLVARTPAHKSV